MFQTVRHWWDSGRGRVTLRLFAFEFIVVVAGVLVAQALAGWADERKAISRMERARDRVRNNLAENLVFAKIWDKGAPCLEARVKEIMAAIPADRVDHRLATRIRAPTFVPFAIDDESMLHLRRRHGDDEADQLDNSLVVLGDLRANVAGMAHDWGGIFQVDPDQGRPSESDRAAARASAGQLLADITTIGIGARELIRRSEAMGIADTSARMPVRPARNCAEIWEHGHISIEQRPAGRLEPRRAGG